MFLRTTVFLSQVSIVKVRNHTSKILIITYFTFSYYYWKRYLIIRILDTEIEAENTIANNENELIFERFFCDFVITCDTRDLY